MFVRSHSRADGQLLWENVIPLATTIGLPACLEEGRDLVFVCGSHHSSLGITNDFMVRAYDMRTGELRWADRPDDGGLWSSAQALTSGDKVFVIGFLGCDFLSVPPGCRFAVRAYDADTGALVWQDLASDRTFVDVVADGDSIFVAGAELDASGSQVATIRAYDADTGALVWVDSAGAGRLIGYRRLAIGDNGLFAGGSIWETQFGPQSFLVRAFR